MKILLVHNKYLLSGGEDSVLESEFQLLKRYGNRVELYIRDNRDILHRSKAKIAIDAVWSSKTVKDMNLLLSKFEPDIVHVHNTLPLISPSIYWVCNRFHIPIVQTLHNFRFMCLNALLLREGEICEDCIGKIPWKGVFNSCYRSSVSQSAVLAITNVIHKQIKTYEHKVTHFIALNEFSKKIFIRGGIPGKKLSVKPNFVEIEDTIDIQNTNSFLYVGRISQEKGIMCLVKACKQLNNYKVNVIGEGSEEYLFSGMASIKVFGKIEKQSIYSEMKKSLALVVPSICYENFPRTIVEAFACGLPVITTRIGTMMTIVEDGVTGLLFERNNHIDLANKLQWALNNREKMQRFGKNARKIYEEKYTAEQNYRQLENIYSKVISYNQVQSIQKS
jgi:glycosyltransferase involved in cell wall biosynthesis